MDNVLAFWAESLVEDGRDEEGTKILRVLKGTVPVLKNGNAANLS